VSTISLFHKTSLATEVAPRTRVKSSPKYECGSILGITGLLLGVILVFIFMGPIIMVPDGSSEVELACNKKIIGFEQQGFYSSPEQYRLALSYCGHMG
jgi:hypothetical protein